MYATIKVTLSVRIYSKYDYDDDSSYDLSKHSTVKGDTGHGYSQFSPSDESRL